MAERLFGVETEYAIAGMSGRSGADRGALVEHLIELAHKQFVRLPELHSCGMFLANGSRFYIDCGLHPEFTTPECANPWDAVRYVQAGDRLLAGLLREFQASGPKLSEVMLFRSNVDYSGSRTTWGCHESYLHRMNPADLPPQVIPHLVSRTMYTGAGGFNPLAEGLEFTLSPRAAHLEHVISGSSTGSRGIFHTKDESLSSSGYHRLHVLCGESLCSEIAAFLKIGATALVVAMAEAGLKPGRAVRLENPLEALQAVARDATCRTPLKLADGGCRTALEIQRHYLELAESHASDAFMPPWSAEICRRWRAMLDLLDDAPRSVVRTLDWAIKIPLYADRARHRGVAWERFPLFNDVLSRLNSALKQTECKDKAVSLDRLLGPHSPVPKEVALLASLLCSKGSGWEEFERFLGLLPEFFEIDTRFTQVGDKGIFRTLDAAGVLDHQVAGVDNIEHAMANPPAIGRGRIRGEVIRRLARSNGSCRADWQRIVNGTEGRILDLSDPFIAEERWRDMPAPTPAAEVPPEPLLWDRAGLLRDLEGFRRGT